MGTIKKDISDFEAMQRLPIVNHAGQWPILTKKQIDIIVKSRRNDKIKFYACPTPKLMLMLMEMKHDAILGLPANIRDGLMKGTGLLIDQIILAQWAIGKLDKRNIFILLNCDIRIDQHGDFDDVKKLLET